MAVVWPLYVYHRYPNVWDNWKFDYPAPPIRRADLVLPGAVAGALRPGRRRRWRDCALTLPTPAEHRARPTFALVLGVVPVLLVAGPSQASPIPGSDSAAVGNSGGLGLPAIARWMFGRPARLRRPVVGCWSWSPRSGGDLAACAAIPAPAASLAGPMAVWILGVGMFYYGLQTDATVAPAGRCVGGILLGFCWGQTFIADPVDANDVRFPQAGRIASATRSPLWIDAASSRQKIKRRIRFLPHRLLSAAFGPVAAKPDIPAR